MRSCRGCGAEVRDDFRFCPHCGKAQRTKIVEYFQGHPDVGDGGAAAAFRHALPEARVYSRRTMWPPDVSEADVVINATPVRDAVLVELRPGQTLIDLPYPRTATADAAARAGATVLDGLDVLVAQGAKSFELWTGVPAPVDVMRSALGLQA